MIQLGAWLQPVEPAAAAQSKPARGAALAALAAVAASRRSGPSAAPLVGLAHRHTHTQTHGRTWSEMLAGRRADCQWQSLGTPPTLVKAKFRPPAGRSEPTASSRELRASKLARSRPTSGGLGRRNRKQTRPISFLVSRSGGFTIEASAWQPQNRSWARFAPPRRELAGSRLLRNRRRRQCGRLSRRRQLDKGACCCCCCATWRSEVGGHSTRLASCNNNIGDATNQDQAAAAKLDQGGQCGHDRRPLTSLALIQ